MADQNLLFSPDLTLNLLSKSSPSQLEPFQYKRSRTQPIPTEAFYSSQKITTNGTQSNGNNSKSSNLSHVPCKFYKQGTCTAGANCTFSHSSDLSSESAVCKYFVKGNCKFGTKCALLHTMSPYGTSATSSGSSNKRMMASTPPSLPFPRRKTADQMMSFSPSNIDHRSFLHDPFASSAPAVSLLHLHEQQQQLWRNQGRTTLNPPDIMGIRSSPRETQDPFLGTSPFSNRLSSSVSNNHNNSNSNSNGLMQSPPTRYQPTSFGSMGQDNYDLNDAMLPSSLNDLFTPSELQVRRVRQQEHFPNNNNADNWSIRDSSSSSFDQRQWRVPFLTKSQQQQQQQLQQQQLQQQQQQQMQYSSLPIDYEDRLIEGTAAINIPGGNVSGSSSSSNDYLLQQQGDLLQQQQDDEVQFFMEDDEAVTYDTTISTTDHKTLDMTASTTANNNSTNKTYSSYPSLISLPST